MEWMKREIKQETSNAMMQAKHHQEEKPAQPATKEQIQKLVQHFQKRRT